MQDPSHGRQGWVFLVLNPPQGTLQGGGRKKHYSPTLPVCALYVCNASHMPAVVLNVPPSHQAQTTEELRLLPNQPGSPGLLDQPVAYLKTSNPWPKRQLLHFPSAYSAPGQPCQDGAGVVATAQATLWKSR